MARKTASDLREAANVLYYGMPGSAKTTNLATMANLGPIVHIDAESGLKPTALRQRGIDLENIEVWPDREGGERLSFDGLDDLFWEMKGELEDKPESIMGIMWDSVTEASKLLLEGVVAAGVAKAERKGVERDPYDTYVEDWGKMTEQMRQLIRRYRDLPCHIGFSALERRDVDDDGRVRYGPALNPALQGDMMGYVDVLVHTYSEEAPGWSPEGEMFLGRTRAGGKYECKDRYGVLPTIMVEPTMERIIAYINGELTADTDPRQEEAREYRAQLETEEAAKGPAKKKGKPKSPARRRKVTETIEGDQEGEDE